MSTHKIILLKQIRERENDPATNRGAQHRVDAAHERLKPHYARLNALSKQAIRETDVFKTVALLRQVADFIVEAMQGIAPCSQGCSHCCNIPAMMTRAEAGVIAHETGRAVRNPKKYLREANQKYMGTPCPFLTDGSCSIYASRPFTCRVAFNLDKDGLLCTPVKGETISVPYFNSLDLHLLEVQALGSLDAPKVADIRDFFKPVERAENGSAD